VIVSLHVATGAATGSLLGSRPAALAAGPILHLAGDAMPHEDIPSMRFELWTGLGAMLLVALARGPLDPATVGAAAAAMPDVEHKVPLPKPRGRQLFPSHRWRPWHHSGGLGARSQLVLAGFLLGSVAASGPRLRSGR
jgi:hypothetical protein